jgi:CBS domain-containing protein
MTPIDQFMVKDVVSADKNTSLYEVVRLIMDSSVGSVIITQTGVPIGIFTEKDIIHKVFGRGAELSEPVSGYMSTPLISIRSDKALKEAAQVMTQLKIRHLPVIDNDKLVGIISNRDILRVVAATEQDL